MPSPGIEGLKTELASTFVIEDGISITMDIGGQFVIRMATGLHNGWTCTSPVTPSTFETAIQAAFTGYVSPTPPSGWEHITAIGVGLDAEVDLWVASWNTSIHTYIPTSAAIQSKILAQYPWTSQSTIKMAELVADAFINYFVQEVG